MPNQAETEVPVGASAPFGGDLNLCDSCFDLFMTNFNFASFEWFWSIDSVDMCQASTDHSQGHTASACNGQLVVQRS